MQVSSRITPRNSGSTGKKEKPVVVKWKGIPMMRNHSINACVDDIFETSKSMGFLKINLIGASSSGKTQLGKVLAHQIHSRDKSFEVHEFGDKELIDFKGTINSLSANNQILIFDDLSGLVAHYGKSALDNLKAEITTVRHIGESNQDRRIIMILNFHAQKMLDKFLRISNFTFYTDCQLEEKGYLEELLGKGQKQKIDTFAKLRSQSRMQHTFSFQLSKGNVFTYKDSNPFRCLLYNNGLSTRFVVSPTIQWILDGETCQVCTPSEKTAETKMNLDHFKKDIDKKFGKGIVKRAVELMLFRNGFYAQPKRVKQAEKYIDMYFLKKKISLEEMAEMWNLKDEKTNIHRIKQPEFEEVNPLKENDDT